MVETASIIRLPKRKSNAGPTHKPKPFARLSPVELAGLAALGRFNMVSVAQFKRISGYRERTAGSGLMGLFRKGLVDRGYVPEPRTREQVQAGVPPGAYRAVYRLTSHGAKRAKVEGFVDQGFRAQQARWKGGLIVGQLDIRHRLLLVDFMIEVALCLDDHPRLSIARMLPDFVMKKGRKQTGDQVDENSSIIPDVVIEIEDIEKSVSTMLLVEVQNGRIPPVSDNPSRKSITKKLAPYDAYLRNSNRAFKSSGQSIVLYVASEPAGYAALVQPKIDWDEVGDVAKLVRLATFEDIAGNALGPVWLNHSGDTVGIVAS